MKKQVYLRTKFYEKMFEFLESLDALHRSFWYVALLSSFVFLLQTVFTFVGGDWADGLEADFDSDFNGADTPFQLFSLRNLTNFLLGFGWVGASFYDRIENKIILVILAALIGVAFVFVFLFLIKQILRFSEDNTFKIQDLVGKVGEVYLRIPANNMGKGKVLISLKGSNHELSAFTLLEKDIEVGSLVKVVKVEEQILIVEKI